MIFFTIEMAVINQIPLVILRLCRQEALHQVVVITQTVNRKKDSAKSRQ